MCLKKYRAFLDEEKFKRKKYLELKEELDTLVKELEIDLDKLNVMSRAANLLSQVSDDTTTKLLERVTGIINSCLGELFPGDSRRIKIVSEVFNKVYPHYTVVLTNSQGKVRSFDQSGSGLAQVISFLFSICLIEAYGGRKIFVMDELLNGLHPEAKKVIKAMIEDVLTPGFQFVVVEYGVDIGTQYEVVKEGTVASVVPVPESNYFEAM